MPTPRDESRSTRMSCDGSPPPCESCERRSVCAAQKLACLAFRSWVSGRDAVQSSERIPTHEIYRQAHGYPSTYTQRFGSKGRGCRGNNQHTRNLDAEIRSAMSSLRRRASA